MNPVDPIKQSPNEPSFLSKLFTFISKIKKERVKGDDLKRILSEEFDDLSRRAQRSSIQSPFQIRNLTKARRLADLLIDEKGELKVPEVKRSITLLEEVLYPLGENRESDAIQEKALLRTLNQLLTPGLQRKLRALSKPIANKQAEDIIKETLHLPPQTLINDAIVRKAGLTLLFTDLRQTVGSCFATAPALLIKNEQPEQFLQDINDLISTGRLKRVAAGVETSVPLSPTFGVGDLRKPFVIQPQVKVEIDNLGFSPGLLNAFERAGLIDSNLSLKERVDKCREIVLKYVSPFTRPFVTNCETIIKEVLMADIGIDEKALDDFLKRPKEMVFGGLMMQMPRASIGRKGVGEACQRFLELFEEAKKGFVVMTENALLKCWEFTLASFAESKDDFTKWTLYISLGISPEEPGGIGQILYSNLKNRIEKAVQKVEEYNREYEQLYAQLKFIEGRVQQASTDKELQWLRVEYRSRLNEFQTFEDIRNREVRRAERLQSVFKLIMEKYLELFPKFFQEVYDAEMNEVGFNLYDDRPAGFRLIYKHGRMNTAQWTRITNPQEYIESLTSFFVTTEVELAHMDELAGFEQEVGEWVTQLINHVKTKEFLESAFRRVAIRYQVPLIKDPLNNLDKIDKKPWAYTSGGSLDHLLMSYFKLVNKPKEVSRWVENPTELLLFIVETLQKLPVKVQDELEKDSKALLMVSPTHAFRLIPGLKPFDETWKSNSFTYTLVRDEYINPAKNFYDLQQIRKEGFEFIIDELIKEVPYDFQPKFRQVFSLYPGVSTPSELGRYILDLISNDYALQIRGNPVIGKRQLSHLLYKILPLRSFNEVESNLNELFSNYSSEWKSLSDKFSSDELITGERIEHFIQDVLLIHFDTTAVNKEIVHELRSKAIELGLLKPNPIRFGDTNWANYYFGFVVNPVNQEFELWRLSPCGLSGEPMSEWDEWLYGKRKDIPWGIYIQPFEYKS